MKSTQKAYTKERLLILATNTDATCVSTSLQLYKNPILLHDMTEAEEGGGDTMMKQSKNTPAHNFWCAHYKHECM
jgi:hypothetical protein